MQTEGSDETLLPHHRALPLCTDRAPYRQGRRLTAVKVYTVANESNHLLIFGVPALNLRQETKALFMRFGKLIKYNISPQHPSEPFTETHHAHYERIQSARIAKRILDTKNFYGGSLHVCYAPEMETIEETRQKILQRQKDVLYRLHNMKLNESKQNDTAPSKDTAEENTEKDVSKLNMGEVNIINLDKQVVSKNKRNHVAKKFKPSYNDEMSRQNIKKIKNNSEDILKTDTSVIAKGPVYNQPFTDIPIEVVDCTSVDNEVITNINEHLNYDRFGGEDVRPVPRKPVNRIVYNVNKKS
ncbi:RNA-binding protein 48 [Battus philenor]|uniref:RNA-binding protein 48 n=1 Tax=Battus philenor TaxID=42288 RepID=UPI0035D02AA5